MSGLVGDASFERPGHPILTLNKKGFHLRLDEINLIHKENCEAFSDFAQSRLPMPGIKKRISQILEKEILIVDFRIMESKHRQNSMCLQIQFVLDNEVCVAFTGSSVLLDQINYAQDKIPFRTKILKIDNYYTLS